MQTQKDYSGIAIPLIDEFVIVGPGTVPTSLASVSKTSIKEMSVGLKKASDLGLFDKDFEHDTSKTSNQS